ncbi:MAG: diadenosine tetraphosphate hydrolase [Candidatus Aenigmatarchaeota archaeon]
MEKLFPDETIITTNHFEVGQDWEIPIPGFFIISSKRKINSVADLNEEESKEFIKLLINLRRGMKEVLKIKDVYLFQNEDSEHKFHLWIFPRHGWMERFGRKIESVRPIMNYAKENMKNDKIIEEVKISVNKIREYMKSF